MEATISAVIGKGSTRHNKRAFVASNVDANRIKDNIEYIDEDIKDVYHKLFDEALIKYNAKQTRSDRVIDDYYEKILSGKQEKPFHEVIFQVGNKDTFNSRSRAGLLARDILNEYMMEFQSRNPYLYVFSAHLHMDEETPHLHIDFIPFVSDSKRGLETRVSLKQALAKLGFTGGTKDDTEWNQWINNEKQQLANVMEKHNIEWVQLGSHEKHLSVLNYEKVQRQKEVESLTEKENRLVSEIKRLSEDEKNIKADISEIEQLAIKVGNSDFWKPAIPAKMQTATSYYEKTIVPFIQKVKTTIGSILNHFVSLYSSYVLLKHEYNVLKFINNDLEKDNEQYKSFAVDRTRENQQLKIENNSLRRLLEEAAKAMGKNNFKKLLAKERNQEYGEKES